MQGHQIKTQRDVAKETGMPAEPANEAPFIGTMRLRQAAKARRLRALFVETGCDRWMTYEQFRQEGVRNKIRRGYGLEAIIIPQVRAPKASANEAKPRRRKSKRQRRRQRQAR